MDTHIIIAQVARLSDTELLAQVHTLAQGERRATIALIAHLAELDARRLFLGEGYSSLFRYCVDALHLSEHATYGRIEAARAVRRFPILLQHLSDGSMNLTTVGLLAPYLTAENHERVLTVARHRSRRETEELVARLRPQPPVPDAIRRLPTRVESRGQTLDLLPAARSPASSSQPADGDNVAADEIAVSTTPPPTTAPARSTAPAPATHSVVARKSGVVTPLAPARYKVQFTADAAFLAKLRQVQALLRHQIPNGDLENIFDRALTALHRQLFKQKTAATDRPREPLATDNVGSRRIEATTGSRHVPATVKRAVWQRNSGRCAFVAKNGRRCTEGAFLEFHHVAPYAQGGPATIDNIELRCRAHNNYEAERDLGRRTVTAVREARADYAESAACGTSAARYWNYHANSVRTQLTPNFAASAGNIVGR